MIETMRIVRRLKSLLLAGLMATAAVPAFAQYTSLTTNGTLGTGTFTVNTSSGVGRAYSGTVFGNTATLNSGAINLTGTSTLNAAFMVDILLVGGGGAGGSTGTTSASAVLAGGGAGGGVFLRTGLDIGGTASISIGGGGLAPTGGSGASGGSGTATSLYFGTTGTYRAGGGGGGAGVGTTRGSQGTAGIGVGGTSASGGSVGGATYVFNTADPSTVTGGFGSTGVNDTRNAGSGGGAGGAATYSSANTAGGSAVVSQLTGFTNYYGGGGSGALNTGGNANGAAANGGTGARRLAAGTSAATSAVANSGAGGGGGFGVTSGTWTNEVMSVGGNGGSGFASISYVSSAVQGTGGSGTSVFAATGRVIQNFATVGDNSFTLATSATDASNKTTTLSSQLTGSGKLRWDSPGTLRLTGSNSQTGATEIVQGRLVATSTASFGSGTIQMSGGGLVLATNVGRTFSNNIVLGAAADSSVISTQAAIEDVQFLVVGGGGGGGGGGNWGNGGVSGGGGGAGGYLTGTTALSASTDVLVGAGGLGDRVSTVTGTFAGEFGGLSRLGDLMAGGGGVGGSAFNNNLNTVSPAGGSGGGSRGNDNTTGLGSAAGIAAVAGGLGASFGSGTGAGNTMGSGGGGAGGQGGNATANLAGTGSGGAGLSNSITGASVTYAAGGGGGANGAGAGANGATAGSGGVGGGRSATTTTRLNGGNGANGTIVIRYTSGSSLGSLTGAATMTTSTISGTIIHQISGSNAAGAFTVNARAGDVTLAGVLSGVGGITFDGTAGGDLATSMLTLSNSNSFSGETKVKNGILRLTNRDALRGSTFAGGDGGSVNFAGLTEANFGGLTGTSTLTLTNTASAGVSLSVLTSSTFGGVLTGNGSLVQRDARLVLNGVNTYTGETRIASGGTVAIGSAGSIASSSTIIVGDAASTGARLDLSARSAFTIADGQTLKGRGTVRGKSSGGPTVLTMSGTLSPGNSPDILTFQNTNLVLDSSAFTLMEITGTAPGTEYDVVNLTGVGNDLIYGGTMRLDFTQIFANDTTFNLFNFGLFGSSGSFTTVVATGAYSGTFTETSAGVYTLTGSDQTLTFTQQVDDFDAGISYGQLVIVPEPLMLGLLGVGSGVAIIGLRRLRRRSGPTAERA